MIHVVKNPQQQHWKCAHLHLIVGVDAYKGQQGVVALMMTWVLHLPEEAPIFSHPQEQH